MKVLLFDVDSTWANLSLMKLSTHHKFQRDEVSLMRLGKRYWRDKAASPIDLEIKSPFKKFDTVYISCLFSWNRSKAYSIATLLKTMNMKVEIGGSGVDLDKKLPKEIEHLQPDYELYGLDYSIGFLTRGCIRNCPWCIVPKKEGNIKLHSPLKEFLHRRHRKVLLLDNNLLAHPDHKELLMELLGERLQVCFNQGLDIRLVDDENAKLLSLIKHKDDEFKNPRLYFSWDLLELEDQVLKGIEVLRNHHIVPSRLLFYLLCGFKVEKDEYTWEYFMENDWHRYETLSKIGAKPFIMKFNRRKDVPLLNAFTRWVNWMFKAKKKELGLLRSFQTFLKHDYPKMKFSEEGGQRGF